MINWRVYYDDGTTFDNTMGLPKDVPAYGVICVVFPDPDVGRVVMQGWDWYYFVPGDPTSWWGSDTFGLFDRLLHRLPVIGLLQGRCVGNAEYTAIVTAAVNDPDFPVKSGTKKSETP